MIFSPHDLVARLSRDVTLEPGDIICCGTSLGVSGWADNAVVDVIIEGMLLLFMFLFSSGLKFLF